MENQVTYVCDPNTLIVEQVGSDGYLFTQLDGDEIPYKSFMPFDYISATEPNWLQVRDMLFEMLNILGIHSSKHHKTQLDIIVTDTKTGKRIDDGVDIL